MKRVTVILIAILSLFFLSSCKNSKTTSVVTNSKCVHTLSKIEKVDATCTERGNIEYYICNSCGEMFKDSKASLKISQDKTIIKAQGHSFNKINGVEPTCLRPGSIEYYMCSSCNKAYKDILGKDEIDASNTTLSALGHNVKYIEEKTPLCEEIGIRAHYECENCNKAFSDEEGMNQIASSDYRYTISHEYQISKINNYTKNNDGYLELKCDKCEFVSTLDLDFAIEVKENRDVRVLQLTDTQIVDSSQQRTADRLGSYLKDRWAPERFEEEYRKYVRQVIEKTNPDLIIITGDLVYGEFDDNGSALIELIEFMDSFEIPWAPIFGNHDNESKKGVDWQCQKLIESEFCMFNQRTLTGNGNYNVGIIQNGKLTRVFYMLDSNGCGGISAESLANGHSTASVGFGDDQIEWLKTSVGYYKNYDPNINFSMCFHIQPYVFADALKDYGYPNIGIEATDSETDFGYLGAALKSPWDHNYRIWNLIKSLGVDSVFVGHEHANSISVMYEGIRLQYGQKSSTYDRANYLLENGKVTTSYSIDGTPIIGGTLFELDGSGEIVDPRIVLYEEEKPEEKVVTKEYKLDFNGTDFDINVYTDALNKLVCAQVIENTSDITQGYTGKVAANSSDYLVSVGVSISGDIDIENLGYFKIRMCVNSDTTLRDNFRLYDSTTNRILTDVKYLDYALEYNKWVEIDILQLLKQCPTIVKDGKLGSFTIVFRTGSEATACYDEIIIGAYEKIDALES